MAWSVASILPRAIIIARVRAAGSQATMQLGRRLRRWETTHAGNKGLWRSGRQTSHAVNIVHKIKLKIKGSIVECYNRPNFSSYTPPFLKGDRSQFYLQHIQKGGVILRGICH